MIVSELIDALQKLTNPNAKVEFAIQTYTQVYPQAYVDSCNITAGGEGCRVYIHLPEGKSISTRKVIE